MSTEIHFKDEATGLEYELDCDLEAIPATLRGWKVTCTSAIPLQMAFNIPFLNRPPGAASPCAQKAAEQQVIRKTKRIGADGTPVDRR